MLSTLLSRLVILLFGTLYPAYASFKAVRTKNIKEYVKWMMYWIVFGIFIALETLSDIFLGIWVPFYYELKILFILWLISPATQGSSYLYRRCIHPWLLQHEAEIDSQIDAFKRKSYGAVMQWGSHGFAYVSNFVMQTAVTGSVSALGLIKRTYSLNDIPSQPMDCSRERPIQNTQRQLVFYEDCISDDEGLPNLNSLVTSRPRINSCERRTIIIDGENDNAYQEIGEGVISPKPPKRTGSMRSVKIRPKSYLDDINDGDLYDSIKSASYGNNRRTRDMEQPEEDFYSSVPSLAGHDDLYPKSRLTKSTRSTAKSQKSLEQISSYATLPRRTKKKKTTTQGKEIKGAR